MIVRIWRTQLDETRADEYERFAQERSLPMFQRHPGCVGVLFARAAEGRAVVTLWDDLASAGRLEAEPEYRATVEAILETGFLRPPQTVELLTDAGGWLAGAAGDGHAPGAPQA